MIEVEVRSFISKEKFDELLEYFKKNANYLGEDYQETFYFDCNQDLRIQKNNHFAKIWLKKGELHDEQREEIEIKVDRDDFKKLEEIFKALGHGIEVKWYRTRHSFDWNNITVAIDFTKGYGYIIELEKMSEDTDKDQSLELLKTKMAELDIEITPKEEFAKKYAEYLKNWCDLVKD